MDVRVLDSEVPTVVLVLFFSVVALLALFALGEYSGNTLVYVLFTVVSNLFLYFGFRKNAIFFDTFLGVFFWLGFWLKSTVRIAFLNGEFSQAVGKFDGSGAAFDQALLVSSCGMFGFLLASYLREKFLFNYPKKTDGVSFAGLFSFYRDHRMVLLTGFVALFLFVAITNLYYGIYQRGEVPRTLLPYGLGGIYKWLLLFGLASFSALIIHFELKLKRGGPYLVAILALLENFISSVSLLSRGMVLNSGSLAYGILKDTRLSWIRLSKRFLIIMTLLFVLLFGSSVFLVNHFRSAGIFAPVDVSTIAKHNNSNKLKLLFLDRWVGIEGVMAISSYPELGWDLWKQAWSETFTHSKTTFYDLNIITTPYQHVDSTKHHYVSLPGIIAFCFYPGSFLFLFGCTFVLGGVAALIEISVYRIGGKNLILCALLAQVVAYRYAHFGYVPKQSYLLFASIYLNLFIFYFADKALLFRSRMKNKTSAASRL